MPGMEEKSPADSKVGGYARMNGRPVGILAANVVFGATPAKGPEEQEERIAKMVEGTDPYSGAALHP